LPSPRLTGTFPVTCHEKGNDGTDVRRKKIREHSLTIAWGGETAAPSSCRVTVIRLCSARAIPMQSKPGPMLEVVPGTLTVTEFSGMRAGSRIGTRPADFRHTAQTCAANRP